MFIGHIAVGLVAKRASPKTNVATFIFAALWCDILFGVLVLFGIEHLEIVPGCRGSTNSRIHRLSGGLAVSPPAGGSSSDLHGRWDCYRRI